MINNQMRITGFASGLDTDTMVRDLMRAERAPLDKLFQKKEWLNWQRDAYRDVNLQLDTFRKAHEKLRFQSSFNGFKATSSDSTIANVTSKSSAVSGTYDLTVSRLAEVAKVTTNNAITKSDGTTPVKSTDTILTPGSGETSQITIKTSVGEQVIDITDSMTYGELAGKITNLTDASGNSLQLRASFDDTTSRFIISSKNTGESQSISISDSGTAVTGNRNLAGLLVSGGKVDAATTATTVQVTGKDSFINFNGVDIQSSTNKVSAFGVDIDLLKTTGTSSVSITVASDTASIFDNIKKFVDDYNALVDSLTSKVREKRNRDFAPLTDEQRGELSEKEAEKWDEKAKSGVLYNDSIVREALSSLREKIYKPVAGIPDSSINLLSEIGITTQYMSVDGKLQIDENKLRDAIADNPDGVANLFTAADGVGTRVYDEVNKQIDKLNKKAGRPNTLDVLDISTIGKDLSEVGKQMLRWEDKLRLVEDRYWKQFTAMEKAIAKMNEQSSMFMSGM